MQVIYRHRSSNTKLGDCITGIVGTTREQQIQSCDGCPMLNGCFSVTGTGRLSSGSTYRRIAKGGDGSLSRALRMASRGISIVRRSTIGDSASVDPADYDRDSQVIEAEGLISLDYTHQWREEHAQHLKGRAMASVETLEGAALALSRGWSVYLAISPKWGDKRPRTIHLWRGEDKAAFSLSPCVGDDQQVSNPTTCSRCKGCTGAGRSWVVHVHGNAAALKGYDAARRDPSWDMKRRADSAALVADWGGAVNMAVTFADGSISRSVVGGLL